MPIRSARPRAVLLLTAVAALGVPSVLGPLAPGAEAAPQEAASLRADAPQDDGGSWSAAPSTGAGTVPGSGRAGEDEGARKQFYLEGTAGTVLKDTVSITNESRKDRTYTLRGADARNTAGGGFHVRKKSAAAATGRWIGIADEKVRVPARTRADIPVTVAVPADTVPGDHPGAVVVGDGERDVAVRIQLRVTGPAVPALSVEDVAVRSTDDGAAEVEYVLVNRGNTVLSPRVALRSDGYLGRTSQSAARDLPVRVPPGKRVQLREPWPDAPALDSADVTVKVTAGGAEGEGTVTYTAVPWPVSLLLVVLLAAGGAGGWYLLRRRGPGPAPAGERDGEPEAEPDGGPPAGPDREPDPGSVEDREQHADAAVPEDDGAPSAPTAQNGQTDGQSELTATGAAK